MLKDVICLFLGHKYVVTQVLRPWSRRLCCARCKRMFAESDDAGVVVDWGSRFHAMYEAHGIKIVYQEWEGKKQ